MTYNVPCRSFVCVAAVAALVGCDLPFVQQPVQVVTIAAPETPRLLYVPCADSAASTKLMLTVSVPEAGDHQESFSLHVKKVVPSRYPSHPGGVTSACGPPSSGDSVAFNRSCYIESAVENAVGIRFRLSYRRYDGPARLLDELIWATIDRDAVIQLSNGASATVSFTSPRPQPEAE